MRITESIPSRLDLIPDFIATMIEKLLYLPLDEEVIFSVKLCLHEAVINAVEHGNKLDSRLNVKVMISLDEDRLTMEVTDQGLGFDHKNIPDPTMADNLPKMEGRGIYLIQNLMNKVEFLNGGRTLKMVKMIQKGRRGKLDIKLEKVSNVTVVALTGEINVGNSSELRSIFAKLLQGNEKNVLVDFEKVAFIDSSGLAVLIEMVQKLEKVNGQLRICSLNNKIKGIFEIVKIHKLIKMCESRTAAIEDF